MPKVRNNEGYSYVPEDYAIDALTLEADRRSKAMGRFYSYGQLVADTTPEERAAIAEDYRRKLEKAIRRGRRRVRSGSGVKVNDPADVRMDFDMECRRRGAEG